MKKLALVLLGILLICATACPSGPSSGNTSYGNTIGETYPYDKNADDTPEGTALTKESLTGVFL